ncbi:hypothetical protein, partial [Pseudomonas aeruginosa]|uniref:hypothetical protein n=1 Tax=Pseudomonas aeruginosa TaxID=287 RepID=UPI003F7DB729
ISYSEEVDVKKRFPRRTDHQASARSRRGRRDQGPMRAPWLQWGVFAPRRLARLAVMSVPDAKRFNVLVKDARREKS